MIEKSVTKQADSESKKQSNSELEKLAKLVNWDAAPIGTTHIMLHGSQFGLKEDGCPNFPSQWEQKADNGCFDWDDVYGWTKFANSDEIKPDFMYYRIPRPPIGDLVETANEVMPITTISTGEIINDLLRMEIMLDTISYKMRFLSGNKAIISAGERISVMSEMAIEMVDIVKNNSNSKNNSKN